MTLKSKAMPEWEVLNDLLLCDFDTGKLFWRVRNVKYFQSEVRARQWNTRYSGREAFTYSDANGYKCGNILDSRLLAHRVIWKMWNKTMPDMDIDHINGNKSDNRIDNLRLATCSENSWNAEKRSDNTSGYKGVSFDKSRGLWAAYINAYGKRKHLGRFRLIEDAHMAYEKASIEMHGDFSSIMSRSMESAENYWV